MKMWFLFPFLIGGIVLAIDDEISTSIPPSIPSTEHYEVQHEHTTESVEDNEIKVSFARGKPQQAKKKEMEIDNQQNETTLQDSSTTLNLGDKTNATANETTTVKTNLKIRPQKMRRKRPFTQHRVFADRIFGKRYGHHKPKIVVNKLKHDLLHNATNEKPTDEPKSAKDGDENLTSVKRKRNLRLWQSLIEHEKNNPLTHGIIYHISTAKLAMEDKELPIEVDEPVKYNIVSVNETEIKTEEPDLEPPKKALLTYRQFVERRLSKLNRAIDPESKNENSNSGEDGSGFEEIGDLPDDHESAPLEENVLSEMAVP